MIDLESFIERFRLGELDHIFVIIYCYFINGYLILFTTYEQNFINLGIHNQILLSIAISYPLMVFVRVFVPLPKAIKKNEGNDGILFSAIPNYFIAAALFSCGFSLFYIIKHLEILSYDSKFNSIIAIIITSTSLIILSSAIFNYLHPLKETNKNN